MESPGHYLAEHAAGYGLFKLREFEEIGQVLPAVEAAMTDVAKFASLAKVVAFHWFTDAESALENCNAVSEGMAHNDLVAFLEENLPKAKKSKTSLGVADAKLCGAIAEALPHIATSHIGPVPEVLRGLRLHFEALSGNKHLSLGPAQLGLGHAYSRSKVKFDVHRSDNMIIQAIALLDQLDKDINTFGMRIREWYSYHFPELYKIVPDQYKYCRAAKIIGDRAVMDKDAVEAQLTELLEEESLVTEVTEAARMSMGMDISELDLANIRCFAERVASLGDYRKSLQEYLKDKMGSTAPNLSTLIGEAVGARLISHAGSLTNLAKYPASTVQILGAEKALFRALKTRGNTPKYGLLFHSTFIGRAAAKNKGRISRYLANKCSLASRIDCFSEVPVSAFGELLKQQVEDRLKFFDTGEAPKKNLDVMREGVVANEEATTKAVKKRKKAAKKAKKEAEEEEEEKLTSPRKRKLSNGEVKGEAALPNGDSSKKKKKKRKSAAGDE